MLLKILEEGFSVCKLEKLPAHPVDGKFMFLGITDEEISLVCTTAAAPAECLEREDGWRCFRIEGQLDFSLIGILSKISAILADHKIGIFVVSTYNTDYILVKKEQLEQAAGVLQQEGYQFA